MDDIQLGVITLMKSAITGDCYPLPEGFDMEQALPVLKHHGIQTMGYLGAIHCGISKAEPVMQRLFTYYCRSTVFSQRQLNKLQEIFVAFDENSIDYMPLKGAIMKHLYPSHELRPMGDADILIRTEQYDRIQPIMESLGFSAGLESYHELNWHCPELHVELHKCIVPSSNQDYYSYYSDGWQFAKQETSNRWQMSAEDQYVFLFTHFSKHFRGGGIGCRHVVDLWIFLHKNPHMDQEYISKELNNLHLLEFYGNIQNLIADWFADGDWSEKTEFISEFIFNSGIWGGQKAHDLASNVKFVQESGTVGKGKWSHFLSRAFPSLEYTSFQYPILRRAPMLLPAIWIARLFHILVQKPDLMKRRLEMMSSYNNDEILSWERNMDYVGLKYWHDS